MGEGPWNEWGGTDSLLDRLVNGASARLEGTGVLELEEDEEGPQENQVPKGPGEVNFALLCDFEEFNSPNTETIQVRLISRDDAAFSVIRGVRSEGLSPLPRYRLSGSVSTSNGEVPIRMDAVTLGVRSLPLTSIPEMKITRVARVGAVTVGSLESTKDLINCKLVIPNFAEEAVVEGGGVRITLNEISLETTEALHASESRGKVLPGSYLEVQRLQEDAGESVKLAVDDIGWLLSFYAGRRIHPLAWEGETNRGLGWRLHNMQLGDGSSCVV